MQTNLHQETTLRYHLDFPPGRHELSQPTRSASPTDPYGVAPPTGTHWMLTFDDEFTKDRSINKKKWNGGAGNTDWCSLTGGVFGNKTGGAYMFGDVNDLCGQHYDGCTLSKTNGLEMRPRGVPIAALQTGGTTARTAKFIQKFGYWEACIKQPTTITVRVRTCTPTSGCIPSRL